MIPDTRPATLFMPLIHCRRVVVVCVIGCAAMDKHTAYRTLRAFDSANVRDDRKGHSITHAAASAA
jgi:hypothetical protein